MWLLVVYTNTPLSSQEPDLTLLVSVMEQSLSNLRLQMRIVCLESRATLVMFAAHTTYLHLEILAVPRTLQMGKQEHWLEWRYGDIPDVLINNWAFVLFWWYDTHCHSWNILWQVQLFIFCTTNIADLIITFWIFTYKSVLIINTVITHQRTVNIPFLLDIKERNPIIIPQEEHPCSSIEELITRRCSNLFHDLILHILNHNL